SRNCSRARSRRRRVHDSRNPASPASGHRAARLVAGADGELPRSGRPTESARLPKARGRGDGVLRPLTTAILAEEGLSPSDVKWKVRASNIKAQRRTRTPNGADRVDADTGTFSTHGARRLEGKCPNFAAGKSISFGEVRYIRPTNELPEIRLRFTPAPGFVYGSTKTPNDPNVRENVYLRSRPWSNFIDGEGATTQPFEIYFGERISEEEWLSRGYLDDTCDGIVDVSLKVGGSTLTSYARISSGPPD